MPRPCRELALGVLTFMVAYGALRDAAVAQDPSGLTVGVIPDVSALRPDSRRTLALEQPVYMGDRIQTGSNGEAQILFIDETRLVIGAASSLMIDSSVMRNRRTMSSFIVNALRGSFRFISGDSPKPAYAIRTPTATIGVRGTQFDFTVLPNGGTEFVLLHGKARVCDRFGNCLLAQRACTAISIPPGTALRAVTSQDERNTHLRTYFPYVRNQYASLRQDFRANVGSCGNISAALPVRESDPDFGSAARSAARTETSGDQPRGTDRGVGGGSTANPSGGGRGSGVGGDARSGDARGGSATTSNGGAAIGGSAQSGNARGGDATAAAGGSAIGGNAQSGNARGGDAAVGSDAGPQGR